MDVDVYDSRAVETDCNKLMSISNPPSRGIPLLIKAHTMKNFRKQTLFMIVFIRKKGKHIHRFKYNQPALGEIIWVQVQVRSAGHA